MSDRLWGGSATLVNKPAVGILAVMMSSACIQMGRERQREGERERESNRTA